MNKLRLFILLAVGLASTAHADFVVDNTSLPTTKTNLRPLPLGADPTKYIQAVDYNSLMQASLDLRTALVNGEYHGLATQTTDPLPVNATNYTWLDLAGALHFKRGGDAQIAYGPVTTKGDILAFSGTAFGRLAAGSDGQCIQAASGQTLGLIWGTCGGTAVGGAVSGGVNNSLLFVGPTGNLAQDNTNLSWNDTTKKMLIRDGAGHLMLYLDPTTGGGTTMAFGNRPTTGIVEVDGPNLQMYAADGTAGIDIQAAGLGSDVIIQSIGGKSITVDPSGTLFQGAVALNNGTIGPNFVHQHQVPNVASDTFALLGNPQTWPALQTFTSADVNGTLSNGGLWRLATMTNNFFDFDPNDGHGVHWRQGVSFNPNVSGLRTDNVMIFGWNVSSTGVIDTTKGHLSINFEDYWINEFGDPQSEWYITAGPPTGVGAGYRPIAINTSHTDPLLTKMLMHAHDIELGAGNGPSGGQSQISITDSSMSLFSPDGIKSMLMSNPQWTLRGHNVAGSSVTISLFDATDPVTQPDVVMRVQGTVVPDGSGHSLGLYGDGLSRRALWANVASFYGQFITPALGPADYDHIGQLSLLYPAAENTFGYLYIQAANAAGAPRWERVATDDSGIHPAAAEGTLHIAPQITGDANSNQFLSYVPAEVGAAKWGETVYQATNAGSARKNQVHAYGWNVSASGGVLVGGEAMQGMSWESYYKPGGGAAVSEVHIIKQTDGGTFLRPFSMEFDRTTGHDTLSLSSDALYFQSPGQVTSYWIWDNTTGTVQNFAAATPITYRTNNVPILAQKRVGGGNANLLKLTSSDVVAVDPDGLGASFGADLAVAGNITTPGNIGSSGTPVSIVYGDNFLATVGLGGLDTKSAGQLPIGSTHATSVVLGHQDGSTATVSMNATTASINSPDGNHSFNALTSGIVVRGNGNALLMSENGAQLYFTVDLATSFAADGLIDLGVAGQRWRSLQIHGGSARPTCDSTAVGKLWRSPGGAGVTDALDMCLKSAADTYTWRSVATGG